MPTSRWRVPAQNFYFAVPMADGAPMKNSSTKSYAGAARLPSRTNLAGCRQGLQPAELDVITNRLAAGGRIERNMRSTGRRPVTLFESPRGEIFWGVRA